MIPNEDRLRDRYDRLLLDDGPEDEDEEYEPDPDCCHHGIGFDEYCEECEEEDEFLDDSGLEDE